MSRFVRVRRGDGIFYGRLEAGDQVHELTAAPFAGGTATGRKFALGDVQLLAPCEPRKIFAVGRNYRSHLGTRPAPPQPELFWKPISALQDPGGPIVLPPDSSNVHFEGELVLVIGQRAKDLSVDPARAAIFGATCGNDVSEREWQSGGNKDLQWWRAKGADTFAPFGPIIATGLATDKLALATRLNGKLVQEQTTADMIFDCATVVSFASRYVTLEPGDLFFTGTPGNTSALAPGDLVEITIEGIGTLSNRVAASQTR